MSIHGETILSNAALSAGTFTSGVIPNDGRTAWSLLTRATGPGASPSLTLSVLVSVDGVNFVPAGTGVALTAAGNQRLTFAPGGSGTAPNFPPITEPFIQVQWVVVSTWSNVWVSLTGI